MKEKDEKERNLRYGRRHVEFISDVEKKHDHKYITEK